jgi:hypothetical protein
MLCMCASWALLYNNSFTGCWYYSVRALRTTLQPHDGTPLYNSSFSSLCRCHASDITFNCSSCSRWRWAPFTSVLSSTHYFLCTKALRDLKTTLNLCGVKCGQTRMVITVGAWGSLQGLTGLAPTREFTWRSHWTTHCCRTINLIYSTTVLHGITIVTTAAVHLKVTGPLTLSLTLLLITLNERLPGFKYHWMM